MKQLNIDLSSPTDFEVYFMRHGETTWNRTKLIQGATPNTVLTARGVKMAERTAEGLKAAGIAFDRIYSSPYLRARRTAEIVSAGTGITPICDERIHEMCFGRYEGLRYGPGCWPDDNLRRFYEEPETYRPQGPGAESFDQVQARIRDFLECELRPLGGTVRRVLCVTHAVVLKSLVRELTGETASSTAKSLLDRNCCVHVVRFSNGCFSLVETGRIFYDPSEFENSGTNDKRL